jgi:hypothetical protein
MRRKRKYASSSFMRSKTDLDAEKKADSIPILVMR